MVEGVASINSLGRNKKRCVHIHVTMKITVLTFFGGWGWVSRKPAQYFTAAKCQKITESLPCPQHIFHTSDSMEIHDEFIP